MIRWTKSSRCDTNTCVEVAYTKSTFSGNQGSCVEAHIHDDAVHVRDSKDPDGPYLTFTAVEWDAFIDGVMAGEFRRKDL